MNEPICVIGGGLAGIAAAGALRKSGYHVQLLEARTRLGGRAASFQENDSSEWIDLCQHVSMGCCTNLLALCQQAGIASQFRRTNRIHFIDDSGKVHSLAAATWLPAPLHLLPALLGMKFLNIADRCRVGRGIWRLLRMKRKNQESFAHFEQWLAQHNQPRSTIIHFWEPILVSALGDTLDRVSVASAQKVFADGFCGSASAYELSIPKIPLARLYDEHLRKWLTSLGVKVESGTTVKSISQNARGGFVISAVAGQAIECAAVVLAVPWWQAASLFDAELKVRLPEIANGSRLESSPITGIHLWFDSPISNLPHAVLLGRTSQWVFARSFENNAAAEFYYQVVISGSRAMENRDKQSIVDEVLADLRAVFPSAKTATLLRAKIITEPRAVFTPNVESEKLRPSQATSIPGLFLAGDWTATDWPATMEGAVRSGYLAAEGVTQHFDRPQRFLCGDLPKSWLANWIIR